jgi:hypothetical protein
MDNPRYWRKNTETLRMAGIVELHGNDYDVVRLTPSSLHIIPKDSLSHKGVQLNWTDTETHYPSNNGYEAKEIANELPTIPRVAIEPGDNGNEKGNRRSGNKESKMPTEVLVYAAPTSP